VVVVFRVGARCRFQPLCLRREGGRRRRRRRRRRYTQRSNGLSHTHELTHITTTLTYLNRKH
jgi:hypothetical protein